MALCPVVASARGTEHEVVGLKQSADGARLNHVDGARLKVDQAGPGHIPLTSRAHVDLNLIQKHLGRLLFIHQNRLPFSVLALLGEYRRLDVITGAIEAMLGDDGLPELVADLVTTLAHLQVKNLTNHG